MAYEYILDDLTGYPYNGKYQPNYKLNGSLYHGYKNGVEEVFYYYFAVLRYDLRFTYKGETYYFLSTEEYAAQCDDVYCEEKARFKDGNDVLENFKIEVCPLMELIPFIEDCEPM